MYHHCANSTTVAVVIVVVVVVVVVVVFALLRIVTKWSIRSVDLVPVCRRLNITLCYALNGRYTSTEDVVRLCHGVALNF